MIVSHALRFVYIKPRKVAGTSVELALSPFLAPGDLATPVGRDERKREVATGVRVGLIRGRAWHRLRPLRDHSPLRRAVAMLGPELLDYRIVTTERNPWDRAVSQFFWSLRRTDMRTRPFVEQKREFERFVRRWGPVTWLDAVYGGKRQKSLSSIDLYTLDGQVMADRVLFFEHLSDDLAALGPWLGLGARLALPEVPTKADSRPHASRDWREFFSDGLRDLVGECCEREIAHFGYAFDPEVRPSFSPVRRSTAPAGQVSRQTP